MYSVVQPHYQPNFLILYVFYLLSILLFYYKKYIFEYISCYLPVFIKLVPCSLLIRGQQIATKSLVNLTGEIISQCLSANCDKFHYHSYSSLIRIHAENTMLIVFRLQSSHYLLRMVGLISLGLIFNSLKS